MKLEQILSTRKFNTWPSWDLVYEWENVISSSLNVPIAYESKYLSNRYLSLVPGALKFLQTSAVSLRFDMIPKKRANVNNKQNIIPYIIDFFLKNTNDLARFYKQYTHNKLVFVSSKEACEYLKAKECPLNIHHLPLSISDKYRIGATTVFDKQYDLVMMGRQNPVLQKYVEQYAEEHPNFVYVYRTLKEGDFNYCTSTGQSLGDVNTREKYMALMKKARVGLYSTPGIDGGELRTNGFNPVTPRFLELIACGCHIIARYPSNSETDYFELSKFSPNIEDYAQFEKVMNNCLNSSVDIRKYSEYLQNHYTSVRCKELYQALINI